MFANFICALFGFRAREFPVKSNKKTGTFFADCTWYMYHVVHHILVDSLLGGDEGARSVLMNHGGAGHHCQEKMSSDISYSEIS